MNSMYRLAAQLGEKDHDTLLRPKDNGTAHGRLRAATLRMISTRELSP
jgi:hypothetical protein